MSQHKLLNNLLLLFTAQIFAVIATSLLLMHLMQLLLRTFALTTFLKEDFFHRLFYNMALCLHVYLATLFHLIASSLIHHFKWCCNPLWIVCCIFPSSWRSSYCWFHVVFKKTGTNFLHTLCEILISYIIEVDIREAFSRKAWFVCLSFFRAKIIIRVLLESIEVVITAHDERLLFASYFTSLPTFSSIWSQHCAFRWCQIIVLFISFDFCLLSLVTTFKIFLSHNIPCITSSWGVRCDHLRWISALLALVLVCFFLFILLLWLLLLRGFLGLFCLCIRFDFFHLLGETCRYFGEKFWLFAGVRKLSFNISWALECTDWILFCFNSCCKATVGRSWDPLKIIELIFGLDVFLCYWLLGKVIKIQGRLYRVCGQYLWLRSELGYFWHISEFCWWHPTLTSDWGRMWFLPLRTCRIYILHSPYFFQNVNVVDLCLRKRWFWWPSITSGWFEVPSLIQVRAGTLSIFISAFKLLRSWH